MTAGAIEKLARLEKRLRREVDARLSAEDLLERKSAELFQANQELHKLNAELEERVRLRTRDLHRQRSKAQSMAITDHLTGLYNRQDFNIEVPQMVEQAKKHGKTFIMLAIDLDRFKMINDAYGHSAGDQLLQVIAKRLRANSRDQDRIFRLGGDEFALVSWDNTNPTELANRIYGELCRPVPLASTMAQIGASIGISILPGDALTAEDLLQQADMAAEDVKQSGGGVRVFDKSMMARLRERDQLGEALAKAIHEDQIEAWLQPIVETDSLRFVGLEALARWPQGDGRFIPPSDFIPCAEKDGLITQLGEQVTRKAYRVAKPLLDAGRLNYISINFSPLQLAEPTIEHQVLDLLSQEGILPHHLLIEITENLLLADTAKVRDFMGALSAKGVNFALDDFGVGYSNLRYLQDLPVAKLKIDRSFLVDDSQDEASTRIMSAITNLAHQFSLQVVVEGVETDAQLALVRQLKCDLVQGFGIGRPMPPEALEEWLVHHSSRCRQRSSDQAALSN